MKKLIIKAFELPFFKGKSREDLVKEVGEKMVETLTKTNLDGTPLSAIELASVLNIINPSISTFLRENKLKTEQKLQEIETALEMLNKN